MSRRPWQAFRDQISIMTDEMIMLQLCDTIGVDSTGYILGRLAAEPLELLTELENNPEARDTARDVLATVRYVGQNEEPHVAKHWMIGLHPIFGEVSPSDLFRSGRGDEVVDHLRSDGRVWISEPLSV